MGARTDIREAVDALPLGPLLEALGETRGWVVGGAVRDLIAGREPAPDIDVAVDGEVGRVIERLAVSGAAEVEASHERFGTATVRTGGATIDLARTRSETYEHPGALPTITPAGIDADLARRDFTVNAMAVPLRGGDLLDPHGGAADLGAGVLRVLHDGSFADDPTRAIRGARYASRLGLRPDERTRELLARTNLGTVSADRRRAELARLAAEPTAAEGFRLLGAWGILDIGADAVALIAAIDACAVRAPWGDPALRAAAILAVAEEEPETRAGLELAQAAPERPSQAVSLAAGKSPVVLLVAVAAGAGWVADYLERWRLVGLEIDGEDVIAAGVPQGPAVGAGLRAALARKLDGELDGGREAELAVAVEVARASI